MEKMLDNIMCSTIEDEMRFADIINKWIADGEVPEYEAFTKESKSTKKKRRKQVSPIYFFLAFFSLTVDLSTLKFLFRFFYFLWICQTNILDSWNMYFSYNLL